MKNKSKNSLTNGSGSSSGSNSSGSGSENYANGSTYGTSGATTMTAGTGVGAGSASAGTMNGGGRHLQSSVSGLIAGNTAGGSISTADVGASDLGVECADEQQHQQQPSSYHNHNAHHNNRNHLYQQQKQGGGGGGNNRPHISLDKCDDFQFNVPPEAPVFEPSEEDFKNPLVYINKIRPTAEKYGICKIRPPSSWQPPFTVDVEKLTFTPRIQRLNELEAETRIKLNFLDQIAKFCELQGTTLKIPMVERKPLDLYTLHKIVNQEGGLEVVTKERKWSKVACRMGYQQGKSVGSNLRTHYDRLLYPFDVYRSGKVVDLANIDPEPSEDCEYEPHCIESRQQVQPPMTTTARRSQRFAQQQSNSKPTSTTGSSAGGSVRGSSDEMSPGKKELRHRSMLEFASKLAAAAREQAASNGSAWKEEKSAGGGGAHGYDPMAKYICHMCNRGDVEESMLLCDGCDASYHTFCLMPPLQDIPKGDWRCPKCIVEENSKPVEAFGFEQAQREYTLQQFGEMADQFKSDYFNMPVHLVPTELVEKEFWRIVSSIDEDVTVEYGADLHTMDHGSGFPTKASPYLTSSDQEYAESSWNLNNLPVLDESILGHINADISGMKVPWMYVGMCFATFCWHNEDHWSYSINYLHWGEPKTWYGVPGSRAEEFELAMKSAAPELFHSQPDLLHQLVTIMNPNILMNANVPVYRTDQHAGEFVVTFPRAYHAGFNQGYNFAEAVNFAPADWMKMGRECVNHYSKLRRYCVFSHDELVCKMALEPDRLNLGIATACYIDMAEMVDTEKKLRKNLLEWGVSNAEREAFELLTDDARQCEICKTTCFLSAVNCKCTKNLACLRHFAELCECPPENHTLKYRYTLDELPLMVQKLKVKAESFEKWLFRVRDVLDPSVASSITLEELQSIAHEAESQKFPNSVILERLNLSILEAQKCITVIQQLDINKIRTRTRNSLECAKYKLTMDELELFINEINNLRCVIREGDSVRELQRIGQEWLRQADKALKLRFKDTNVQQLNQLIEDGNGLCIELPQITELRDRLTQYKWYREVRTLRENTVDRLSLEEIKKLINEGMRILPHTVLEKELSQLHGIMLQIVDWEQSANQCFKTETQHKISEIDSLLERAQNIEAFLPLAGQLKDVLHKSKEWLHAIEALESSKNYNFFHTLQNLANRAKLLPVEMESKLLCETIFGTTTAGGGCYNRNGGQMLLFNSRGFIGASGEEWRGSRSSSSPSTSLLKRKRKGSISNLDDPIIPSGGLETIMKKIKEDSGIGEQDKRLLRAKLLLDWNESEGGLANSGDKHMLGSYASVQKQQPQQQHRPNSVGCDVVYHCAKCYEMVAKANVLRKYRHKQHHHHCRHHERHSRAMAVKQEQNQQQTANASNMSAMEQLLQIKILSEDDFAVVKGATTTDAAGSSFDDFSFKFGGDHYDGEDEPDDEEAADEVKAEDEDDDEEEAGDGVGQLGRNGCHGCKPPDEHRERESGVLKPLLACTAGASRIKAEPLDNADSSTDDREREEARKARCLESTSQGSESQPTANGGNRNSSGANGVSTSTNGSQQQQQRHDDRQRQEQQHQQTKVEHL
ncbi:lysine-specific demethylase lid [Anopheles stephensi]|uniref:lysine-specific demethylase lid n=1 Tax=Anopheles stephensi TaxID=30069 RepID=UPI0016588575|nr:lysine-specific demethylase lid [Anopheles stephensi]